MTSPRKRLTLAVALLLACTVTLPARAQMPTDEQMQAAIGGMYDMLGLFEYCQAKGFATAADVATMRDTIKRALGPIHASSRAMAQEKAGRQGTIVGPQFVGKINLDDPAHLENVPAGRTTTLAENAAARKMSEHDICGEMREMNAPP